MYSPANSACLSQTSTLNQSVTSAFVLASQRFTANEKFVFTLPDSKYDALVLGVSHKEFANLDIVALTKEISVVYDVKGFLKGKVDGRL